MTDATDRNKIPKASLEGAKTETLAVRAGQIRSPELEHSEAIFPTSSFVFSSAQQAAARFAGDEPGNIYSRFTNPTVKMFEDRIAAMEGAERGVATSSGMAAILSTCLGLLQNGDHIVSSRSVFGTTNVLFEKYLSRAGITTTFVDLVDVDGWKNAVQSNTKLFFLETPSNPLAEIADIAKLAELAHGHDALLVVDNCFCTPILQKPIELGADIVIHSATKYLDGQGRCIGGVAVGKASVMEEVYGFLRSAGTTMSPFNAWVFLKGLETLGIRMRAHSESALKVAQWLTEQPRVEKVFYSGLESHPQYELASKQQSAFGGVVSFTVRGGRAEAWALIDSLKIMSITANLGDAKTTITHPATTTHGRLSDEVKAKSGISENLIRMSIGLEDVQDIIGDLQQGLASIA
ncbi:MAG: O-succinylhomoserine sulfhydrylase [Pseudomonadales bacterium]|nr:O-succinylhomoserine sulfhydrylase [Pseudomonadales bacterium]